MSDDAASSPAVRTLKNHMQAVKKELDEYVDKHRLNCEQLEVEKAKRDEVRILQQACLYSFDIGRPTIIPGN